MLILLNFICFWCNYKVQSATDTTDTTLSQKELAQTFIDEMNYILNECCYPELFAGNPYDWFFMYASLDDDPLSVLNSEIGDFTSE